MNSVVEETIKKLFEEVSHQNKTLSNHSEQVKVSDDLLLGLNCVFGKILSSALDIVDKRKVSHLNSADGRDLYKIVGESGRIYYCPNSLEYCPCASFAFGVIKRHELLMCKHLLAVKLSLAMNCCNEFEDQFSLFLVFIPSMWIWYQLSFLCFLNSLLLFCIVILAVLFAADISGIYFNTACLHAMLWPNLLASDQLNTNSLKDDNYDDKITKKIHEVTGHIIHDYILSWYNTVSHDVTFVQQAFEIFEHIFLEIRVKICATNALKFTEKLFHILRQHIITFKAAQDEHSVNVMNVSPKPPSEFKSFQHPASQSKYMEMKFLRSVVTQLLNKLLPKDYHLSGTSAYVVRELIAHNVLHSVIDMASEPAWIYTKIIEIFGSVKVNEKENQQVSNPATIKLSQTDKISVDKGLVLLVDSQTDEDDFDHPEPERPPVIGQEDVPVVKSESSKSLTFSNDHFSHSEPDLVQLQAASVTPEDDDTLFETMENSRVQQCGILFKNIRIHDTMTCNESHDIKSKYTLYRVTYSSYSDPGQSFEHLFAGSVGMDTEVRYTTTGLCRKLVCRRFREFLTLQDRLQNTPVFKSLTENIQGPSRMFPIPFGNMDKSYIEQRRVFLQAYLRQLASISGVSNCVILREFLAYKRDPRIAFVQRNDSNIPRIDKLIRNAVSDLFLSRKENRLSTTSTDEEDDDKDSGMENPVKKLRNMVLRSSTKMEIEDMWDLDVEFAEFEGSFNSNVCPEYWEDEDRLQDLREMMESQESRPIAHGVRTSGDGCDNDVTTDNNDKEIMRVCDDCGVQSILLIAREIWGLSDGKFCLLSLFVSQLLQKYIELNIQDLTSHESWYKYMELFKKHMFDEKEASRKDSDIEKLRQQASLVLQETFPGILNFILDEKTYLHGVDTLIDSFSDVISNRNILFHLLVLIMDNVFL